ncbi:hypothetical protein JCGZ_07311 [Jatropha curcas]|uniref:Uncharacterized protein n=1 Tax=Jatropha curcas TaxID=180498 RepID=A0A067KNA6_JATCU|nr:uncharacterized protein LOC105637783 [Jatropha curcas]KDP33740.1 hypothetical protein JCGZ_07311 [Jatropha curcas]
MALSPKPNLLIGENYGLTLNQSIHHLLAEIRNESLDSSHFIDIFYQLMQSKIDPPIETIWVYSALSFRSREITSEDLSANILVAKELFQFISGCSAPCSVSKSIALLAPVVFKVYKLVVGLLGKDLEARRVKKAIKEVKSLIGAILGYIGVCCVKNMNEENDSNLRVSFSDLISLWMEGKEGLEEFLPLMSDDICKEISVGLPSVNYLAGVVIAEIFLLKLCFDLRVETKGVELEKEMRSWTVGSITGLRNFYFFDTLLRMLLEPTLPLTSLLSSEDERFLRTILYDATVLVEYSFLSFERAINLPADHVRNLVVKRLIITHEAIELSRKNGDRKRAISYTCSFSSSQIPSQIIKFVTSQIGMEEEASRLKEGSPRALIKWLLDLDGKGIRIFDDVISKFCAKLALDDPESDYQLSAPKPEGRKADVDLQFYVDNKGEEEDHDGDDKETNESMSAAFLAAAHTMRFTENGGRKRKEGRSAGRKRKTKVLKHDLSDNSDSDGKGQSSVSDDSSGSESEVENPTSDEDV